jgi:hypothetical protein
MMNTPKNELIVLDIAGNRASVTCDSPSMESTLCALGFSCENDQMVRKITDDSDRQCVVRELIALDALFSAGRDWSPSELVDYYREQGFVSQGYRMITWKSPDRYVIATR